MLFKYYITLCIAFAVLLNFNLMYTMHYAIPHSFSQEEQTFLNAIGFENNAYVERFLQDNPTFDINRRNPNALPYTLVMCYLSDNSYILTLLIDKGLDTTTFVKLLSNLSEYSITLKPKVTKIILEHGALKQLNALQQIVTLINLLVAMQYMPQEQQNEYIQLIIDNGLDIAGLNHHIFILLKTAADAFKHYDITMYSIYAIHLDYTDSFTTPVSNEQATRAYLENKRAQDLMFYITTLDTLKNKGLTSTLKYAPYKQLLTHLANQGSTDFVKYLVLNNSSSTYHDLETIITSSRAYTTDQKALETIEQMSDSASAHTDQEKTIKQETINYLQHQWLAHKNKSVVKLLRRLATIARLFATLVPKELAYTIAQHDIADFQDQKLALLPSYDQVREFIAQRT